ncbi:hydrogen voltage-gated channel 1 [Metarhizium album ARSEF 1941]|uniref:Voltage-gated hydrogen channel 1 n=1 Tax=Metarhizium album (strain ARSEF 1941) TaxID=1081103 RepID=A0A0B2WRV8_METAS|nr:hydrogen voltage-gated channel 1 [Metarhizium album ARSEF 1941]KHN96369.1 hydrogen voltage-gated channel 1 [Metarhizium album ARSEF 1941]
MSDGNTHIDCSAPLLPPAHHRLSPSVTRRALRHVHHLRRKGRVLLASRSKHFVVMFIVMLDVMALLANVFIQLIACEMHQSDEEWVVRIREALETAGLVSSCLFMVELAACLFSFGLEFLTSWFHVFDSAVIVVSFVIDVASQGLAESIGSLVVVLRLWRLAKISEEVVMGATERMEILEQQMEELEHENRALKLQLGLESREHSGQE